MSSTSFSIPGEDVNETETAVMEFAMALSRERDYNDAFSDSSWSYPPTCTAYVCLPIS